MEEIGFLVITFDSEVQMTSGFHWHVGFVEIFHMTPIMTIMVEKNGPKWPKIAIFGHF